MKECMTNNAEVEGVFMDKNQVKGIIDEVAGSAMRKAGELTDNPKLEVKGMIRQGKGRVENAWEKTKEVVRDTLRDSELHIDTRVHSREKDSTADTNERKSI